MAGKGSEAKANLMNRIISALGSDYVGAEDGKKFYFNSTEAGQTVQVCLTMTCPKVPFEGSITAAPIGEAGSTAPAASYTSAATNVELSDADRAKIEELKKRLGIAEECPF